MANIVIFHSILGLRKGIIDMAEILRKEGHIVYTPDLYFGEVFDDMQKANKRFQEIGIQEMMSRTHALTKDLPNDIVYTGFSNGGASAELLAGTRSGAQGCLLFHAALPLNMLGIEKWPSNVPAQIHYAFGDPMKNQDFIDELSTKIKQSGSNYEYFNYQCNGHLFTDRGLPDFDQEANDLLLKRVIDFLKSVD